MKEKHPKEKLTRANIRTDIKRELRKMVIYIVALVAGIILLIACTIALLKDGIWPGDLRTSNEWYVYLLIGPILYGAGAWLIHLIRGLKRGPFITTGVLVSSDYFVDRYPRSVFQPFAYCHLRFNGYGELTLSADPLHPWSKLYPLSPMGEYYYASEGDEYYLVLSKPHSGKILMAYNKKLFELVD